jgi:hypothetical protein
LCRDLHVRPAHEITEDSAIIAYSGLLERAHRRLFVDVRGALQIENCPWQIENWGAPSRVRSHSDNLQFAFCNCQSAITLPHQRQLLPGAAPEEA